MPYWLDSYLSSPLALTISAAIVVAVCLLYWFTRPPKTFRAFDTAGGEVLVTRRAVRELVRRCCEELGEVGSASVQIRLAANILSVHVRLRVRRSANLKSISGYLREQIAQALTENLGVEEIGEIAIVVVGILEDAKPAEA